MSCVCITLMNDEVDMDRMEKTYPMDLTRDLNHHLYIYTNNRYTVSCNNIGNGIPAACLTSRVVNRDKPRYRSLSYHYKNTNANTCNAMSCIGRSHSRRCIGNHLKCMCIEYINNSSTINKSKSMCY
jgi:hypothetical protein